MTNHALCAHVMRGAACSPRERSARRAARDVSTRLVLPFVLLQMVASLVFPCGAFALTPNDQGVLWGPTSLGGGNSGIVVSATNNFDAALWAIGRWNTKIQLDSTMFSYLSNADTGGHFYELASYFHSYAEVGTPNWPNAAAVEGYAISFGPSNVWIASVPSSLISQARDDYNTVLGGGSLGGGSSGGDSGGYYEFEVPIAIIGSVYPSSSNAFLNFKCGNVYFGNRGSNDGTGTSSSDRLRLGSSVFVRVPKSAFPVDLSDGYVGFVRISTSSSSLVAYFGYGLASELSFGTSTYSSDFGSFTLTNVSGKAGITNRTSTAGFSYDGNNVFTFSGSPYWNNVNTFDWSNVYSDGIPQNAYIGRLAVAGPPAPPDNNWPTDEPTPTPDPPEVPGPSDDPIVEPDPPDLPNPVDYPVSDPYTPDPDPPTNPVITYDPNPTGEPTDYRPWLNAILVLLRKINTTISDGFGDLRGWLTNHCDHIREQIHSDSVDLGVHIQTAIQNGFVSFERWLQGTFAGYFVDQLDYVIGQQFAELESYLYDLFHWLAGQFDFTFGGESYDDSSVLYWLRRIYARLSSGAPNPGEGGTVDKGFDWWGWLLGIITDALSPIITDFVGDVGGFLATLADVFPFSIPGDIVAYLTLLDAARETPRFVVTIPAVEGWWQSFDYEIDLAPFDDAMSVVRGMYLIYWGLILVMKTDWLGGVFDFASRAVVQFFDKITGGAYSA